MSLVGPLSTAFNKAVEAAYSSGVITVCAAGNDGVDASKSSPASAAGAITVGALDTDWTQAYYSNFGSVLDIYAPGTGVLSTWITANNSTKFLSGTSMATPHVTGLVLYLMAKEGLATPAAVVARLNALATTNSVKSIGSKSPNLIAYNGNGA
jgi:oryzin